MFKSNTLKKKKSKQGFIRDAWTRHIHRDRKENGGYQGLEGWGVES